MVRAWAAGRDHLRPLHLSLDLVQRSALSSIRRVPDGQKVGRFAGELAEIWSEWLGVDDQLLRAASELERLSPVRDEPPPANGPAKKTLVRADSAEHVMGGVYAVRNNLFHGSKQFDAVRDHALVKTSSIVLERVMIDTGLLAMTHHGHTFREPLSRTGEQERAASPAH